MTLVKLDLRKELKHLYNPPVKQVVEVDVPAMNFLMVDGEGDPNTALEYQESVEGLYSLAYALKFAAKKSGLDYPVMPLEGLWWIENMGNKYGDLDFTEDKSRWHWTMMIMQPDAITPNMVEILAKELKHKKNQPVLDKVRFGCFDEGLSAQVMHIGPYNAEKPTIDRLHAYIAEQGYERGKHHEIYLGDPRRTQPEKLRTVIRQPMSK